MKTLEIPSGGMPFTGDDLLWMQQGLIEAVIGVGANFLEPGAERGILSGCEVVVNGDVTYVGAGWLVLDSIICYFEGWNGNGDIGDYELYYEPSYDPAGHDVFADNVSRDTYKLNFAKVRSRTVVADNFPGIINLSILDEIRTNIKDVKLTRIYFTATKSKVYLIRQNDNLILSLSIGHDFPAFSSSATGTQWALNPIERPKLDILEKVISVFDLNGVYKGYLYLDPTTGVFYYYGAVPSSTEFSYFVQFSWML